MKHLKSLLFIAFSFATALVLAACNKKTTAFSPKETTASKGTTAAQVTSTKGKESTTKKAATTQEKVTTEKSTTEKKTTEKQPEKIATPTNFIIAEDVLTFDEVANSDCYSVKIYKSDDLTKIVLSDEELINPSFSIKTLGSGKYTAKVTALAELDSELYLDSDEATYTFEIENLGELYAPKNLAISNGYITWECDSTSDYEVIVTMKDSTTPIETSLKADGKKFMVAGLNIENGDYTIKVRSVSNRHNSTESEYASYDFTYKVAKEFTAEDIATFNGAANSDNTGGEHGAVELIDGYAVVKPTADGWGRVASPSFNVDFDKNPVIVYNIGTIIGGYHTQLTWNSTLYVVLSDTQKMGNICMPLNGISTESSVKITATGVQSIVLRLGVSNSTTTTANDARAYYKGIKVVYISEYSNVIHESEQIAQPENIEVNDVGKITWKGCANATHYAVKVTTRDGETTIYEQDIENTYLDVTTYAQGEYTITVNAINKEDETYTKSEAVSYSFVVNKIKTYTASEIKDFVSGGGGMQMGYDEENDVAIYNPNGNADYGWSYAAEGIELDLSTNPLVIVNIVSVTDGGYLCRAKFTGKGEYVMNNDTPGAITSPIRLLMRVAVDVNETSVGSGTIEGYVLGFGVCSKGEARVSSIEYISVTKYKDALTDPVQLEKPETIEIKNDGSVEWSVVENANKYQVKITSIDGTSTVYDQAIKSANINVAGLLEAGDYKITVVAINDENELLLDSKSVFYTFTISNIVVYTPNDIASFVKAGGDDHTIAVNESGNVVINGDEKGWGWDYPTTGVNLDLTLNPLVVVNVVSITGSYLARAQYTGSDTIIMKNDTNGPLTNSVIVMRVATNVDGSSICKGEVTSIEDYKFGFGFCNKGVVELSGIKIVTVSTYQTKLETPNLTIENGTISWKEVENADKYEVVIMNGETPISTEEVTYKKYNGHLLLDNGTYSVVVKAVSNSALFSESDTSTINVTINVFESYSASEIAEFAKAGGDNMTNTYDEDGDYAVINEGGTAGWGWSYPTAGINLDLTLNPLVVVDLLEANEGGYLARAEYTGSSTIIMKNDTSGPFGHEQVVMRVATNVDGNPICGKEVTSIEGYKFGFGVRANGILKIKSIRIVSCEALVE